MQVVVKTGSTYSIIASDQVVCKKNPPYWEMLHTNQKGDLLRHK